MSDDEDAVEVAESKKFKPSATQQIVKKKPKPPQEEVATGYTAATDEGVYTHQEFGYLVMNAMQEGFNLRFERHIDIASGLNMMRVYCERESTNAAGGIAQWVVEQNFHAGVGLLLSVTAAVLQTARAQFYNWDDGFQIASTDVYKLDDIRNTVPLTVAAVTRLHSLQTDDGSSPAMSIYTALDPAPVSAQIQPVTSNRVEAHFDIFANSPMMRMTLKLPSGERLNIEKKRRGYAISNPAYKPGTQVKFGHYLIKKTHTGADEAGIRNAIRAEYPVAGTSTGLKDPLSSALARLTDVLQDRYPMTILNTGTNTFRVGKSSSNTLSFHQLSGPPHTWLSPNHTTETGDTFTIPYGNNHAVIEHLIREMLT